MAKFKFFILCFSVMVFNSCSKSDTVADDISENLYPNVATTFSGKIDLNNLANYENQSIPNYITKDNTNGNPITNK